MNVQSPNDEHPRIDGAGGRANAARGLEGCAECRKSHGIFGGILHHFAALFAFFRAFWKYFFLWNVRTISCAGYWDMGPGGRMPALHGRRDARRYNGASHRRREGLQRRAMQHLVTPFNTF